MEELRFKPKTFTGRTIIIQSSPTIEVNKVDFIINTDGEVVRGSVPVSEFIHIIVQESTNEDLEPVDKSRLSLLKEFVYKLWDAGATRILIPYHHSPFVKNSVFGRKFKTINPCFEFEPFNRACIEDTYV